MTHGTADDIATINRISAVPAMLQVITEMTGMRFAAVARVTQTTWTACAVLDKLGFGLQSGGELDLVSTLCLATTAPITLCPAMNHRMWLHPATQANVMLLRERGAQVMAYNSDKLLAQLCGFTLLLQRGFCTLQVFFGVNLQRQQACE